MQAFGTDRVRVADDGRVLLSSRLSKGWKGRVEKTLTTSQFPGTAVFWEEAYYEVIEAEPLASGGVRYVLLPWRDEHAMRVVDRYDADSEAVRVEEHRRAIVRERSRVSANLLGMFTGQLPASVQEELGREIGIMPTTLTLMGVGLELGCIVAIALYVADGIVNHQRMPALSLVVLAVYLGVETLVRFNLVFSQKRPIGSTIGLFLYVVFYAAAPNRAKLVSPFRVEKGLATPITDAPEDVALRDAFLMREPLITLLTPAEQAVAAERFDYDYRRQSYKTAGVILAFSILGLVTSLGTRAVLSSLTAAALIGEQALRLHAFRNGPAPSVLGWLARPFVRKLLV